MEVKLGYKGAGGWTFSTDKWLMECRSVGMDKAEAHRVKNALMAYPKLVEALRKIVTGFDRSERGNSPLAGLIADDARSILRELGEINGDQSPRTS